jgi:hypothetical protein
MDLNIESKTYARKFVHKLQRNISENSCRFIFRLVGDLVNNIYYMSFLKSLYFKDEVNRHVIACYEVTKIILEHARVNNKCIMVEVCQLSNNGNNKFNFILKPYENSYVLCQQHKVDTNNNAVMVFKGLVKYGDCIQETQAEYMERFMNIGLQDIIFSNMAQHPQYSGVLLNDKKYNPYHKLQSDSLPGSYNAYVSQLEKQFLKHKFSSAHIGCSSENQSLFFLTHVRCNYVPSSVYHAQIVKEAL